MVGLMVGHASNVENPWFRSSVTDSEIVGKIFPHKSDRFICQCLVHSTSWLEPTKDDKAKTKFLGSFLFRFWRIKFRLKDFDLGLRLLNG